MVNFKNEKMKKSYIVSFDNEDYKCVYMFDTENGDGVDIKDSNGEWVGEIFGLRVPDVNDVEDDPTYFISQITEYLERELGS